MLHLTPPPPESRAAISAALVAIDEYLEQRQQAFDEEVKQSPRLQKLFTITPRTDEKMTPELANRIHFIETVIKQGFAGIMTSGELVDRRQYPKALPVPAHQDLGIPEPQNVEVQP